jgi:hypothetical protein
MAILKAREKVTTLALNQKTPDLQQLSILQNQESYLRELFNIEAYRQRILEEKHVQMISDSNLGIDTDVKSFSMRMYDMVNAKIKRNDN